MSLSREEFMRRERELDNVVPAASDPVNSPSHYLQGGIECIEAIEAALTPEEFRGYCKGSAFAYVWRERHKGGGQDLGKAAWYLARAEKLKP